MEKGTKPFYFRCLSMFDSSKNRHRMFLLLLLALPFLIFFENFIPGRLVLTSDQNLFNTIQRHRELAAGWGGGWNDLFWLGMPAGTPLVNVQNILIWLLPPVFYMKISIPCFLAIGGLSAFVLGRAFGFSPPVSLIFALGWELVGSNLTDIPGGHHSRQLVFGILPLMYLGLWRAYRTRGYPGVVLASIVAAVMAAELADTAFIFALSGVCFFLWLNRSSILTRRFWGQAVVGTALTLLLCGQMFFSVFVPAVQKSGDLSLPAAESAESKWEWHTQWSFAPEEILELITPGLFGWQSGFGEAPYWGRVGKTAEWNERHQGFRNFRIDNPTTGTAVAALAVIGMLACWRRRRAGDELTGLACFFSWMALATFLLSLGKYFFLYRWIYNLHFFDFWRNPNKFFFVTSFCLVFLAGFGAQAVHDALAARPSEAADRMREFARKMGKSFFVVCMCLTGAGVVLLIFDDEIIFQLSNHSWTDHEPRAIASQIYLSVFRGACFWGIWGGLILAAFHFSTEQREKLSWVFGAWVLMAVVEMWFVASHYMEFFKYEEMMVPHPMLKRVIEEQAHESFRLKMVVSDSIINQFYFNQVPLFNIQIIDIPAASRVPDDYNYYFTEMEEHPVRMWELGNVKYVIGEKEVLARLLAYCKAADRFEWVSDFAEKISPEGYLFQEVSRDDPNAHYRLLKSKYFLPRAVVVPNIQKFPDTRQLFHAMNSDKYNPRNTILVLPHSSVGPEKFKTPAKTFGANIEAYGSDKITISASSDQPACVLLNNKFDPGWTATVNGQPAEIFRANFIVQGIEIPAGSSEIVFSYNHDMKVFWFTAGAWIVMIVFGCIFALFSAIRTQSKGRI